MALAREARGDAESGQTDPPGCGVHQHIGGLDVLVDQPASVELAKCAGQGHGEPEELSDLHRLPDEAIEGRASRVIDNQHRLSALAHQFHWPQCPRGIQVLSKFVFVREAIEALERRMLSAGRDGYERVPIAVGIIPPKSAERTAGFSPQHL